MRSARNALINAAHYPVRLVPIRLDLEIDGSKVRDCFTWNLNGIAIILVFIVHVHVHLTHCVAEMFLHIETIITPEQFAQLMVEDIYEIMPSNALNLITQIANSIRSQCQSWQNAVHDEEDAIFGSAPVAEPKKEPIERQVEHVDVSNNAASTTDENGDGEKPDDSEDTVEEEDFEWRTVIRLDLQIGEMHLLDQFEWPMMPTTANKGTDLEVAKSQPTPESFARQMCAELGLGSEFASSIAHSIREQLCFARLNFDEVPKLYEMKEMPLRKEGDEWKPFIEHLSEDEIDRRAREQERTARRLRRSQRYSTNVNTIVMSRSGEEGDLLDRKPTRSSVAFAASPRLLPNAALPFRPAALYQQQQQQQQTRVPYRNYQPTPEEQREIMRKLGESVNMNLPVSKSPPKRHRGFGASANRFNEAGELNVGEFRETWRCSWCLLSGKFTPTLRKGPNGSKTLCNSCGIWYGKHGSLPKERYHEHADDTDE